MQQRRSIATVVLIPLIGVVLLPVLVDIATDQLPQSWDQHLWLAWPLAALLAGSVIWIEVRRARAPALAGVDRVRLDRAAGDLAEAVTCQWRAEAATRALNQPAPIPLGWQLASGEVSTSQAAILTNHGTAAGDRLPTSGALNDLAETLLGLPNRQLVALGPPGAGKSALTLVLTLDLLVRRRPADPVPVLLTPADWDPRSEHLDRWLARRLVEEYPALADADRYGTAAATALVATGRVLPVLDGLDEMPRAWQPAALAALNEAVAGGRPLVLTCRTQEYQAAVRTGGVVLATALVAEIGPVQPEAAITYLASAGPAGDHRWEPVFSHLRGHPAGALAAALSRPLMIWLARMAYQPPGTDPGELLDRDPFPGRRTIEDHLLDAFIPAVYQPRPTSPMLPPFRGYPAEHARTWLAFLAGHLHRRATRELAWWELHRTLPRTALTGIPALGVLLVGVAFVFLAATVPAMQPQVTTAVVTAATTVPVACLTVMLAGPPAAPARLLTRLPGGGRELRSRAAVAMVAVPFFVLMIAHSGGLPLGIASGVVGLVGCAIISMVGRLEPVSAPSPSGLYRSDRRTLVVLLVAAVLAGLFNGLLAGSLVADTPFWIIAGLDNAIVLGLAGYLLARSRRPARGQVSTGLAAAAAGMTIGALAGAAIGMVTGGTVGGLTSKLVGSTLGGLGLGLVAGLTLTASGWFAFTRTYLAVRGQLPWRLLTFLQDAQRRGVLRQVGGVYQFRHARLQDRLTTQPPGNAPYPANGKPANPLRSSPTGARSTQADHIGRGSADRR